MMLGKMVNISPDAFMDDSVLSAVRLRGNVVHNTIEADILSKNRFLASRPGPQYTRARSQITDSQYQMCGDGLSLDIQGKGKGL